MIGENGDRLDGDRMEICSLSMLVLHETLLVAVLMYASETMLWKEKSRIRAVKRDNFRGLLGIRRMDRVPNARIRELCGVKKGIDERIDEGVILWFGHVERMKRNMTAERVYVRECAVSRSVGRPRKRWIDTVKECFFEKKFGCQAKWRIVKDRSEWRWFVRGNSWDVARGMNP